ncbi:MAG: DNA gyrase subunit A, partial [Acidobacteria bacterium]|nr:DNA gyrase subunit A [Acidobacteriota bacterium]
IGMTTRDEDFVEHLFVASTHAYILIFTTRGRVHWLKVHEIPQIGTAGKGKNIANFVELGTGEKVAAFVATKEFPDEHFLVFCTSRGIIKKTSLAAYSNPRSAGIIAIVVDEGDELLSVKLTDGHRELFMATAGGQALRCAETEVRTMGRGARGVIGMRLHDGDEIVEMDCVHSTESTILSVTANGYAKRTEVPDYRMQGRGGSGIINLKVTEKTGTVVQVLEVSRDDQVMLITAYGKIIRTDVKNISILGRPTQGVRLIHLQEGDTVVAVARVADRDDESRSLPGSGVTDDPAGESSAGDGGGSETSERRGGNGKDSE